MYISFQHVTPMIRGIGNVLFSQLSNIKWSGSSGNSRWTSGARENPVFFFSSLLLFPLPSLLLSISRLRVYIQNGCMWTCCRYTRRRFDCTHGGVMNLHTAFSSCHTTHTAHTTSNFKKKVFSRRSESSKKTGDSFEDDKSPT